MNLNNVKHIIYCNLKSLITFFYKLYYFRLIYFYINMYMYTGCLPDQALDHKVGPLASYGKEHVMLVCFPNFLHLF